MPIERRVIVELVDYIVEYSKSRIRINELHAFYVNSDKIQNVGWLGH